MLERLEIFPRVIEMNYQARRRLGCCVYLIFDGHDWLLLDIGFTDTTAEIIEMIRRMDFPLANCRYLIASHADVDHIQGFAEAKRLLPNARVLAHRATAKILADKDAVTAYASIPAQGIELELPDVAVDRELADGDVITLGSLSLKTWDTPGHAVGQIAFQLGNLLFSGDNVYRDGGVGNIDAHHGSDIPDFIASLERIRDDDSVEYLLPAHGPVFRKNRRLLQSAIDRLTGYLHLSDFGTCAVDWPLLDDWDDELVRGFDPANLE